MLRRATAHRLAWCGQDAGYCLAAADGSLLELELRRPSWAAGTDILAALLDRLGLPSVRCFSFDSLLLGLCVEQGGTASIEGPLFRDLLDERGPEPLPGLQLRPAGPADVDAILPHREGLFDTDGECREWIARGCVSVLERVGTFLGVGLLTRVWPRRPEHDVGVMVHPDHRRRGYASYILRELKRRCLDQGGRPTAGCAARNVASARALQRAGFLSQHSLIRFDHAGAGAPARAMRKP